MAKSKQKPIQHPEYEKAPMDRRTFAKRVAIATGIMGGVGYLALAPEKKGHEPAKWYELARKDSTGLRSVPREQPVTLRDFTVAKPSSLPNDMAVAFQDRTFDAQGRPEEYTAEQVRNLLTKAVDGIGGIEHYIEKGDVVMIKPNVAFDRSPNLGATSNPQILNQLIRMCYEAGADQVRVTDNPIESAPDCFRKSKVDAAAADGGARIYLPDDASFKLLRTEGASLIEEWTFLYKPFVGVNKVIGLTPVKDHNLCHASMSCKNWYGLLGGTRNQFHQDIDGIISDLAIMMRPTFTILDATNVLMENGPTGGDPSNVKKGNALIATLDTVMADTWAFEHALERGTAYPKYLEMAVEKSAIQHGKDSSKRLYTMDWKRDNRIRLLQG